MALNLDLSDLFDLIRKAYAYYAFCPTSGKIKMPLRYILELTYRCNLNCPFCYIKGERCIEELSTQQWIDIIKQIPPFRFISFVAGEVLLKEDFETIFKAAASSFRKVSLISNGLLLTPQMSDFLIKNNLFLLSVSLDAIGANHDMIRKHKGLFDKVIFNLEYFDSVRNKHKLPMLDIKTCVLDNNLDDIVPLYKQAMKLNAQFFSLTFIRKQPLRQNSFLYETFSEDFYLNKYPIERYFDMEHFKEIYKELESLSLKSKTIVRYAPRFKPVGDIHRIEKFFSSENREVTELYKNCLIPMTSIYINPNGDIYPCLSYKVASLKNMTLKEAINTTKFKCFRKNLYCSKVFNACQMCCDAIPKNL